MNVRTDSSVRQNGPYGTECETRLEIDGGQRKFGGNHDAVFRLLHCGLIYTRGTAVISGSFPFAADISVVVRGSTPDIPFHGLFHKGNLIARQRFEGSGQAVPHIAEGITLDDVTALRFPNIQILSGACGEGGLFLPENELIKAEQIAFLPEIILFFETIVQVQAAHTGRGNRIRNPDFRFRMRSQIRRVDGAALHGNAILCDLIFDRHRIHQIGEVKIIVQSKDAVGCILQERTSGTGHIFPFQQTGMRRAIRINKTVHTEIAVMREFAKISAIAIFGLTVRCASHPDSMIAPFPHKAARKFVIAVESLEIILDIPGAVAHGMNKFALDKGLFQRVIRAIMLYIFNRSIHTAVHVDAAQIVLIALHLIDAALVMNQSLCIYGLNPSRRLFHVGAIAGLIAQGPHQNTGAVLIALYVALYSVKHSRFKARIVAERAIHPVVDQIISIAVTVRRKIGIDRSSSVHFNIGFVDHIKAEAIVELRGPGSVGIMTGTDGIHIMLLHQNQIRDQFLLIHRIADKGIAVMTVCAAKLDGNAVEIEDGVADINPANTDVLTNNFPCGTDHNLIKIRRFRVPEDRVRHREGNTPVFRRGFRKLFTVGTVKSADGLFFRTFPLEGDIDFCCAVIIFHRSAHGEIADVILRP